MPFEIIRNDITNMQVDAIVNTANPLPIVGPGTDASIHRKAGPQLLQARQSIGAIQTGSAAITPAYQLQAKYVIHTVGPIWEGGSHHEESLLRSCYDNSLRLAVENHCQSIAFPFISTGAYGFPKDKALKIAIAAFSEFLLEQEMQIYLVVFDSESFRLSEKLFQGVASYIDAHYADEICRMSRNIAPARRRRIEADWDAAPKEMAVPDTLEDFLRQTDAGFTETLLRLIDQTGKKDSEIYKRAGLTKQHFSKIRNNPDYRPTKPTALALAIALELDLDSTKDLIGRAGYALTSSSKFDLIVRYFIEQGNYNIVEINIALYEFDQSLLGVSS